MDVSEIEGSIIKYLSNEATSCDLDRLTDWISITENERIFQEYVQFHLETMTAMNKPDIDKIKRNLLIEIAKERQKRTRLKIRRIMKYAAVALLFVSLGYFWHYRQRMNAHETLMPKDEAITLTLDNGTMQSIDPTAQGEVVDVNGQILGSHDKSKLIYTGDSKLDKLVYNTLRVPYGKKFDVILSDGTHIYLNSGTSLRYPIKFLDGADRKVFLQGEAYFEVAKDERNPFVVNADQVNVQVLGTKFNVSHYPENPSINTVLVEGLVELYNDQDKENGMAPTLLKPGFKGEWDKESKTISMDQVNTGIYTAWIQGKLIFRNTPFKQIRESLERTYNVTIKNKNQNLDQQLFDATFDVETIEEILESFSESYTISYSIVKNEIIIE